MTESEPIPTDERRPVLEHGDISVVPAYSTRNFIVRYDGRALITGPDRIERQYNNIGQCVGLFGPDGSKLLQDLYDVIGVLFLLEGFERTNRGTFLEEMKFLIDEDKLDRVLTDPYTVRQK